MLKDYIGKDSYLAWSVYMRENKRLLAYTIYRLPDISPFQTIDWLDDITSFSYKQVGDILLESAKKRYIV